MTYPLQGIAVLGATGSIGQSTLDVVRLHPNRYRVVALTGFKQLDRLFADCLEFRPEYAVTGTELDARVLQKKLSDHGSNTRVDFGQEALSKVAVLPQVDAVMAAIVGAAGLPSALAAAKAGKRILLANKEALVMAGPLFMREVERGNAELLPIDSEHNAVFQSLPSGFSRGLAGSGVIKVILTASGGPFRNADPASLGQVTPAQAVAHPNWSMGRKISVDSATMMNKGLEVIEAAFLFGISADQIEVVIHPQSIIHSMVSYSDGSVLAELGNPDMRTPIAHSLAYPNRIVSGVGALDLVKAGRLDFMSPDHSRFPCLELAFKALRSGGTAPAVLNAANEVAVDAFLGERIGFMDIARVVGNVLENSNVSAILTLDDVYLADKKARDAAFQVIDAIYLNRAECRH